MKNETTMYAYNGKNGELSFKFSVSRVIGITMAPDGQCFANLKNFRQAKVKYHDYMKLKELSSATQTGK